MSTVYVFGVQRPMDKEPWFLAFESAELAREYPHRCTEVRAVTLPMLPVCDCPHCGGSNGQHNQGCGLIEPM